MGLKQTSYWAFTDASSLSLNCRFCNQGVVQVEIEVSLSIEIAIELGVKVIETSLSRLNRVKGMEVGVEVTKTSLHKKFWSNLCP